jgi:hypothetical protein
VISFCWLEDRPKWQGRLRLYDAGKHCHLTG